MASTDTATQPPAWFGYKQDRQVAELVLFANRLGGNCPVACWVPGPGADPALRLTVRRWGRPYELTVIPEDPEAFDYMVREVRRSLEELLR